ncbi:MAG: nucleoside 2-deoxyribosyltransferase [Lachnospiraceae bacterium]|nr:nucleoside 2-deoxyribosyltransferase [Lachnospiraceae bacterium]
MKIYLASPFFDHDESEAVTNAEFLLQSRGFEVYSPRQHEVTEEQEGSPEWSFKTFQKDKEAIDWCDCMVMLYWGAYSDSGTAWECGYAYGVGKPVVVVQLGDKSNLMVHEGSQANLSGVNQLAVYDFEKLPKVPYQGLMI